MHHLLRSAHFVLILLIFSQHPLSISYVDKIEDKMERIKPKIEFIRSFYFPMQLHRTKYERNFSVLLLLFFATVFFSWTVCHSGPCPDIMNTGRIYSIFSVLICHTNLTHSMTSISASFPIVVKLIVSNPHQLHSCIRSMSV